MFSHCAHYSLGPPPRRVTLLTQSPLTAHHYLTPLCTIWYNARGPNQRVQDSPNSLRGTTMTHSATRPAHSTRTAPEYHSYTLDLNPVTPPVILTPILVTQHSATPVYSPFGHPTDSPVTLESLSVRPRSPEYADELAANLNLPLIVVQALLKVKLSITSAPRLNASLIKALDMHADQSPYDYRADANFIMEHTKMTPTAQSPSPSSGFCPITVQCYSCGSAFRVLRADPTTYKTPPTHCIYCGSTNLSNPTTSNDSEASFLTLATLLNLPLDLTHVLYTQWSQSMSVKFPSFQGFVKFALSSLLNPTATPDAAPTQAAQ